MNKFERDFSEISYAIVIAYRNYEIWWLYKHEREKYVNIMNNYLAFFTSSISAHFVALLMSTSRLIDDKYLSLKSLYKKLKNENLLEREEIELIEKKFKELENIIKGVKIIRSNVFAHISEKIDSDEAFAKAKLKYDDFKVLIFGLGEIFNIMRKANGMNILGFWINSTKSDTEKMLIDLIKYKKQKKWFKILATVLN